MSHEKFVRRHLTDEERKKFLKKLEVTNPGNKLADQTVKHYTIKIGENKEKE